MRASAALASFGLSFAIMSTTGIASAADTVVTQPESGPTAAWKAHQFWEEYEEGQPVQEGYVLANRAGYGVVMVPLSSLGRRTIYMVKTRCYGTAADASGEWLLQESALAVYGGLEAVFQDSRTRAAYRAGELDRYAAELSNSQQPQLRMPEPQPVTRYNLIVVTSSDAPPAGVPAPSPYVSFPLKQVPSTLLEAADEVHCGNLTFNVYVPEASRFEAEVTRQEVWHELVYDGSLIPDLMDRSTEPTPHGWVKCSLSAPDLGFIFADGSLPNEPEREAELLAAIEARQAELAVQTGDAE